MPITNPDYSNLNYDEMAIAIGLKAKHMPILIMSFVEESEAILLNLKTAIDSQDFDAIKMHAHSIKGSAGNLRFNELYDMAKSVELSAADKLSDFEYMAHYEAINKAISTIQS